MILLTFMVFDVSISLMLFENEASNLSNTLKVMNLITLSPGVIVQTLNSSAHEGLISLFSFSKSALRLFNLFHFYPFFKQLFDMLHFLASLFMLLIGKVSTETGFGQLCKPLSPRFA